MRKPAFRLALGLAICLLSVGAAVSAGCRSALPDSDTPTAPVRPGRCLHRGGLRPCCRLQLNAGEGDIRVRFRVRRRRPTRCGREYGPTAGPGPVPAGREGRRTVLPAPAGGPRPDRPGHGLEAEGRPRRRQFSRG